MEKRKEEVIVFDYTSFLGADCKKKWTFYEVFISIAPLFGFMWKNRLAQAQSAEERLWEQAFNVLSANNSDESNIIHLALLAKNEGLKEFKLMMPYELDQSQLETICKKSNVRITHCEQDDFIIHL